MIPQIMRPVVEGILLSSANVLENLDKWGNKKHSGILKLQIIIAFII